MTDDPLKDWVFGSWTDRIWHRCPGEPNHAHTMSEGENVVCTRCRAMLPPHLAFIAQIAEHTDEWKNLQEFVAVAVSKRMSDVEQKVFKVKKR